MASPRLMARATPKRRHTVSCPLRDSSPSCTSSWTRVALCSISQAAPTATVLPGSSPRQSATNSGSNARSRLPPVPNW